MAASDRRPNGGATARVLVVDDHQGTLDTVSAVLRLEGFETETALCGADAIGLARTRQFDVALVDLRLPDMSGLDVVRRVGELQPHPRMVIVTAFPTLETCFEAAAAGAVGYVEGPLFGEDVVVLVSNALSGTRPLREPVCGSDTRSAGASKMDPRLRRVVDTIDANLGDLPTVDRLAASVGLSESRLRHLFREALGAPISVFELERRLQVAAQRLRTSYDPAKTIAHAVGFRNAGLRSLRSAFRRRFGTAPNVYRKTFGRVGK
jgi:DNA-binding response OmpR family regulator